MTISRVPALAAALVLAGLLSGCGGQSRYDRLDAQMDARMEDAVAQAEKDAATSACRAYLLNAAGSDRAVMTMLDSAQKEGTWENEPLNDSLAKVSDAATAAGVVPGLTEADFERYRDLADATEAVYAGVNPSGSYGEVLTRETVDSLRAAVDAVREVCSA
jgi:uncharacterized protein YdbL (DUF1318 family)